MRIAAHKDALIMAGKAAKQATDGSGEQVKLSRFFGRCTYHLERMDEHHIFLVQQTRVLIVDIRNPKTPVFQSEKLSNMDGFWYDAKLNRLLVYNTIGHAWLYDMTTMEPVTGKLNLKVGDLCREEILACGPYLWYVAGYQGIVNRIDLRTGEIAAVMKEKGRVYYRLVPCTGGAVILSKSAGLQMERFRVEGENLVSECCRREEHANLTTFRRYQDQVVFYNLAQECYVRLDVDNLSITPTTRPPERREPETPMEEAIFHAIMSVEYPSDYLILDESTALIATWSRVYRLTL